MPCIFRETLTTQCIRGEWLEVGRFKSYPCQKGIRPGRMRLNPRNIFSEIAGQSQNLVPLPGHTARSHFPAIFAAQCSHGLSSSQRNLGVNDVTRLQAWSLIISHVPFFMLFLLPWWMQKPNVEDSRAAKWKESGLLLLADEPPANQKHWIKSCVNNK